MDPISPSFDTWTSLFLVVAGFGYFLGGMLLFPSENRRNNAPIAGIVLAFSLILSIYVGYWTEYVRYFPVLMTLPTMGYYLIGPLLYLHLYQLKQAPHNAPLSIAHFTPALLILLLFTLQFSGRLFQLNLIANVPILGVLFWLHNPWLIVAHLLAYALLSYRQLKPPANAQNAEWPQLYRRWGLFLLKGYGLFTFAYVSYYVLVNFAFFNSTWDYSISFTMSLAIYGIGCMAYQQPAIFNGELYQSLFLEEKAHPSSDANEGLLYERLIRYLEQEQPYRDSELRLVHLADQLGYSTHLLSQLINQRAGKNFNQFINDYRLKEAAELLINEPQRSIKEIYFEVGFHNKATFYQAFKRQFQCTPSEFRNRQWRTKSV